MAVVRIVPLSVARPHSPLFPGRLARVESAVPAHFDGIHGNESAFACLGRPLASACRATRAQWQGQAAISACGLAFLSRYVSSLLPLCLRRWAPPNQSFEWTAAGVPASATQLQR